MIARLLKSRNRYFGFYESCDDPEGGFTFIETLIALGIILILTATVGFMSVRFLQKAKEAAAESQIETLTIALEAYNLDCGNYPTEEQGLAALLEKPSSSPSPDKWAGPYLMKAVPKDPWGEDYHYSVPGPNSQPYGIVSYGADRAEGGSGSNADITSFD